MINNDSFIMQNGIKWVGYLENCAPRNVNFSTYMSYSFSLHLNEKKNLLKCNFLSWKTISDIIYP